MAHATAVLRRGSAADHDAIVRTVRLCPKVVDSVAYLADRDLEGCEVRAAAETFEPCRGRIQRTVVGPVVTAARWRRPCSFCSAGPASRCLIGSAFPSRRTGRPYSPGQSTTDSRPLRHQGCRS